MTGEPALSDTHDPWRTKPLRKKGRGLTASLFTTQFVNQLQVEGW